MAMAMSAPRMAWAGAGARPAAGSLLVLGGEHEETTKMPKASTRALVAGLDLLEGGPLHSKP
jgi:hypothetical protein